MASRRRKKGGEEEHVNHERWLVSYADFITLLFAFFVVMYAISSVNEGKYRVLSESLEDAFSDTARSLEPIQIGELKRTVNVIDQLQVDWEKGQLPTDYVDGDRPGETDEEQMLRLSETIKQDLSPFINENLIEIKKQDLWVEIEMKSSVLFPSGGAALSSKAIPVLKKIADVLIKFSNPVYVEGYTDNVPIDTFLYPSNWELSSARASSVVQQFIHDKVLPGRLAAVGYGEFHPVGDNSTVQGRFQNRRIVIVLLSRSMARHHADSSKSSAAISDEIKQSMSGQGVVKQ